MIEEIKRRYRHFGDATIFKIEYLPFNSDLKELGKQLLVYMKCYNWEHNDWEKICLSFRNITRLRLFEDRRQISVIFEALLLVRDGQIIMDFFPSQADGSGSLEENINSDLSIHSKSIIYNLLE